MPTNRMVPSPSPVASKAANVSNEPHVLRVSIRAPGTLYSKRNGRGVRNVRRRGQYSASSERLPFPGHDLGLSGRSARARPQDFYRKRPMKVHANKSRARRGVTTVQYVVMLAVITLGVISAVRTLGSRASTGLNSTAGNVANPSTLPSRFGS